MVLSGVILFYLVVTTAMGYSLYRIYQQHYFSFHLLFSGLYFVTFFLGFPFSLLLSWGFGHSLPDALNIVVTLGTAFSSYLGYLCCYQLLSYFNKRKLSKPVQQNIFAKRQANLTACSLFFIALVSLLLFVYLNQGLLFFKLEKYSQLFSNSVNAIPLKRFFYFFIPALLIWFFLSPSKKQWGLFLILGLGLGGLSYLATGGTRANMAIAFLLFVILGFYYRYLTFKWIVFFGLGAIGVMSILAFARYNLDLQGLEVLHTLLYLTRDTFSPWQNLSQILSSEIDFLGIMPIIRDFYVYIPTSLWQDRPDIVWNSANYFTKVILGNQSGLAISPTLLGSFYIMGGYVAIIIGMAVVATIIWLFDTLFKQGSEHQNAIVQAYCLANIFNLMVLVREGLDAFVSRFVFFSLVFLGCYTIAVLIVRVANRDKKNDG